MNARRLLAQLTTFPWRTTAQTLWERFREDRLGLAASSLTFTTTIALVPFFTVALAVFTAFPMFGKLQSGLQTWLVQSLVPDAIARQVLGYLTQFAGKASRLGVAGLAALLISALALVLTMDKTLNTIWRVRRPRPLSQRVLIYWAVMTLGPLLLAGSLSISSYVISASRGLVSAIPGGLEFMLDLMQLVMLAAALAAIYRWVPNTPVRTGHAWAGGSFAALALEGARHLLAWYIALVPTYSAVYGTFATVPILLVWIYMGWVIVLLGAVVTAYLPSLLAGVRRRAAVPGWRFQLALEILRALDAARATPGRGLGQAELTQQLEVDAQQLTPVLDALLQLDWVGRVNEVQDQDATRFVLLVPPERTTLEPLVRTLLLPVTPVTQRMWQQARMGSLLLREVL